MDKERRNVQNAYHRMVVDDLKKIVKKIEEAERLCDKMRIFPDDYNKFRLFGKKD